MKIKVKEKSYDEVMRITPVARKKPRAQSALLRNLIKTMAASELKSVNFSCRKEGMERLGADEPCLVLMNHSCFIDLKIAFTLLVERPFHIICTSDGFVGKEALMRSVGCVATRKFQSDASLIRDMVYVLKELKSSILMYPEASYSFDGTATPLPESLGKCLKLLGVPVVMIKTHGAFARDPLYNNLQVRSVEVSADMTYLLSPHEIKALSVERLNAILREQFTFDAFRWQQENGIRIDEPFRADCLNRVLYKCPNCLSESAMSGKGETITCGECGSAWRLDEYGYLAAESGETRFKHIPDWYAWQRAEVRDELLCGGYRMELPVDICVMVDMKSIYRVGEGTLIHDCGGFHLTGCGGKLDYLQKPAASYSLYSDFYWYEIADVICIGDDRALYYCFPRGEGDVVAKARLAAEELYKITKERLAGARNER